MLFRSRGRALNMAELRSKSLAVLSADTVNAIIANSSPATGSLVLGATAPVNFTWTVPGGALAPTSSLLTGRYLTSATATSAASFTDSVSYAASARSAAISCSTQGASDTHCTGASAGGFKPGSTASFLSLVATDALGRAFTSAYNAYALTIAN